jgi:hypothetical protein
MLIGATHKDPTIPSHWLKSGLPPKFGTILHIAFSALVAASGAKLCLSWVLQMALPELSGSLRTGATFSLLSVPYLAPTVCKRLPKQMVRRY